MQTIYISGKIADLPYHTAKEKFDKAQEKLKGAGYAIVNPMCLPHNHDGEWESLMKEDLKAMLKCDAIYMLQDWKSSKGATIEYELAKVLKLEVLYE